MIIELLEGICKKLEEKEIEYMLSGSVAMSLYAVPRFTRDIDIVVNLKEEKTDDFFEIFSNDFYFNKNTVFEEVKKKGMFNVIDNATSCKIDFVIRKDDEFRKHEFSRKQYKKVFHFNAWVVSAEDLVISKIIWIQQIISQQQITDIRSILSNPKIDKGYIKHWCKKLSLSTYNLI